MSLTETKEHSVKDDDGRILYFSTDHFVRDIIEGDCCFICGASPGITEFNDEHVIPDWILRQHKLHIQYINLPNGTRLRYDQYKVPCCRSCNTRMGQTIEEPVSALFDKGYAALVEELKNNGPWLLFTWLNLIFLKTHLKDRSLRLHRDQRIEPITISELYDWSDFHHVHCVTRAFYTGAKMDMKAMGSIFVWPAKEGTTVGDFDYGDYYPGQAIFVRLRNVFALAVLNDACGVFTMMQKDFQRFTGPLSPLQCREMLAHAAYANMLIETRPEFRTEVDFEKCTLLITADVPPVLHRKPFDPAKLQEISAPLLARVVSASDLQNKDELLQQLLGVGGTFLYDADGNFVDSDLPPENSASDN